MPVDTAKLRKAHDDFLDLAAEGGFGPPPACQWDASKLLAHLISADASIASVALAVAAGQRPAYDNRPSLDDWNLRRISGAASGLPGLARLLRGPGEMAGCWRASPSFTCRCMPSSFAACDHRTKASRSTPRGRPK